MCVERAHVERLLARWYWRVTYTDDEHFRSADGYALTRHRAKHKVLVARERMRADGLLDIMAIPHKEQWHEGRTSSSQKPEE